MYIFVFLGLFTPGPNIILLTASGAHFGFRATIPHVLGVAIGCGVVDGSAGLGLAALLLAVPTLTVGLKLVAAIWILWLAWALSRVSDAPGARHASAGERPFTLLEAVLFQWINPKIWAVALAAATGYPAGLSAEMEALRLGTAFTSINLIVCLFWTFAGTLLARLLTSPFAWTAFRRIMGFLLAASALMVFL